MKVDDIFELITDVEKPGTMIKDFIRNNFSELSPEERQKLYNKIYSKWYRNKNKDYFKKKNKEYREKNPEKMRKYMKKYYRKNKEEIRKRTIENRKKLFEKDPAAEKAYREYQKEYREKQKEKNS